MSNYRPSSSPGSASPKSLTSERIAADIAAFNKAGGRVEVLGNTPFQHKTKEANPANDTPAPAKPAAAKK